MIKCSKCGIEQNDSEFAKWRRQCRTCRNELQKVKTKRYDGTEKGKVSRLRRQQNQADKGWDNFYIKYKGRERSLKSRYGITQDDYNRMLYEQKGTCSICKNPEIRTTIGSDGTARTSQLCVDHCHKTGKVRGLLCYKCNSAIGFLGDSIETLAEAILYLQKSQIIKKEKGIG